MSSHDHAHAVPSAAGCGCGGGQHGGGKPRDDASLRLAILAVLAERPRTGLAISTALTARGFCDGTTDAGTVYPMLSLMTDLGLISEMPDAGGHATYVVLDAGARALTASLPVLQDVLAAAAKPCCRQQGQ